MKKFNFAALLPGFLALNNSVWASDSSTAIAITPLVGVSSGLVCFLELQATKNKTAKRDMMIVCI